MQPDFRPWLFAIADACHHILAHTRGVSLDGYRSSRLIQAAVERELILIAEAVVRLRTHAPAEFARLPRASSIVALRNRLVHEYDDLDPSIIFVIATQNVPDLHQYVSERINQLPPAKEHP